MDNTPGVQPPDELVGATDDLSQKLTDATDGVGGLVDNFGQAVEDGITNAEQKLDDFIGGLDRFLGKF
jgi:hypothetical protein